MRLELEREDAGLWIAEVCDLPGVITCAFSAAEAKHTAIELARDVCAHASNPRLVAEANFDIVQVPTTRYAWSEIKPSRLLQGLRRIGWRIQYRAQARHPKLVREGWSDVVWAFGECPDYHGVSPCARARLAKRTGLREEQIHCVVPIVWEWLEYAFLNPKKFWHLNIETGEMAWDYPPVLTDPRYVRLPLVQYDEDELRYEFACTTIDAGLRERLCALCGREGDPIAFTTLLRAHPEECRRWLAFRTKEVRSWIVQWLAAHALSPTSHTCSTVVRFRTYDSGYAEEGDVVEHPPRTAGVAFASGPHRSLAVERQLRRLGHLVEQAWAAGQQGPTLEILAEWARELLRRLSPSHGDRLAFSEAVYVVESVASGKFDQLAGLLRELPGAPTIQEMSQTAILAELRETMGCLAPDNSILAARSALARLALDVAEDVAVPFDQCRQIATDLLDVLVAAAGSTADQAIAHCEGLANARLVA